MSALARFRIARGRSHREHGRLRSRRFLCAHVFECLPCPRIKFDQQQGMFVRPLGVPAVQKLLRLVLRHHAPEQ